MVLIYSRDMLWYQNRLLMVLFDDANFWLKMRMKINVVAKTNMGSTSTPRPNQRHQQVAWAYSTTSVHVSFFWRNKPYIDFVQKSHLKFMASSGELCQICAQLRGALRALAMGHNGFLWSCKVKLHSLGAFWAVCQFRRALPELAGAGELAKINYAISVNRITAQVSVSCSQRLPVLV